MWFILNTIRNRSVNSYPTIDTDIYLIVGIIVLHHPSKPQYSVWLCTMTGHSLQDKASFHNNKKKWH